MPTPIKGQRHCLRCGKPHPNDEKHFPQSERSVCIDCIRHATRRRKICEVCCDIGDRRPEGGVCPGCGLPFVREIIPRPPTRRSHDWSMDAD